jgi:HAD superfamily hydrolase (TIGR01450 family)
MRIAVIGLGAMGARVATRLLERGEEVVVWTRSTAKLAAVTERGAIAAPSPAAAAREAVFLITMVADAAALRAVSDGPDGIAAGAHGDLTVLEMSTVGPPAVVALRATLPPETVLLDAPVLGSVSEVEAGTLTILVGGPESALEHGRPLLTQLGTVIHVGPLGAGAAAKLVANSVLFGTVTLLGEAIAFARDLALAEEAVYEVLAATPLADQAERRRAAIAGGEYPRRFALSLAIKDARLIRDTARAVGSDLRLAAASESWLVDAEAAGLGDRDYVAVVSSIGARTDTHDSRSAASGPEGLADPTFDGLIVDLDGVVWLGGHPIAGAVEAVASLRERGIRLLFLTNDPSSSREDQAARLTAIGVRATVDDVLTSAAATARFLAGRENLRGRRVFVIGSPAFRRELVDAGLEVVSATEGRLAELVVVGGHAGFDFAELREATRAVAGGAELVAAGRDRFIPTDDGPEPATGAILAAVETASGITATVIGKPEPYIFELAREALPDCERVAVVGDNLASDVAGAKRAGLVAILVLTGVATAADVVGVEHQPDFVLASLAELATRMSTARS